ncbi:hypothetical protein J2810_004620 [Chryseobacterium rhizosphaerae]|uniref:hypothetical protein n=1 Tax=Chryseobacterium rhizosphaerae TaxID=395937 RepID=UPI0028619A1F|nr:hypothetical protein [Chryseobacterium rhizosphaerae]MDR6548530.1 hypothetical protein [Chryseobacterium rhizosphaerae]
MRTVTDMQKAMMDFFSKDNPIVPEKIRLGVIARLGFIDLIKRQKEGIPPLILYMTIQRIFNINAEQKALMWYIEQPEARRVFYSPENQNEIEKVIRDLGIDLDSMLKSEIQNIVDVVEEAKKAMRE